MNEVTDMTHGVYRRLYSGFIKGQRINKLSLQAEAWFWRVLATVDDFGNGEAEPDLCHAATAGRRKVTASQIQGWLKEMATIGLIRFYSIGSEKYLHIVGFEETQPGGRNGKRIRRTPIPGESKIIQVNPGESKIIQIDPENPDNTITTNEITNEDEKSSAPDFISSLKDNPAYSHIDFEHEVGKMRAWLSLPAHKGRKLTQRFVLNWLNKIDRPVAVSGNGHRVVERYVPNDAAEVCTRCFNTGMENTDKGAKPCNHK